MATGSMEKVTNNSGSGYCKMPDGTLIQWGKDNIAENDANKTVLFPVSFSDTNYSLTVSGGFAYIPTVFFVYSAQTINSVIIWKSTTDTHVQPFSWIAIGRWK